MQANPSSAPTLILKIQGIGHVQSFKNRKRICGKRLVTQKRASLFMKEVTDGFVWQLLSLFRTRGIETQMGPLPLSLIACWIPPEDSLEWIAELSVSWRSVSKGNEGALVEITPL